MAMTWTIDSGPDVPILRADFAKHKNHWVLFVGDIHWDHPKCNQEAVKRLMDLAVDRDAAIIDLGDFFCAMQGRFDRRGTKSSIRDEHATDDYFNRLVEDAAAWLEPYRENLAVMLDGNHVTAIRKHNEINLVRMLRMVMRGDWIYPGYSSYVIFRFTRGHGRRSVPAWIGHGTGGGAPVTKGTIQAQRRAVKYPDARFLVTGHIHNSWMVAHPQLRLNQNGRVEQVEQQHYSVGAWKDEFGTGQSGWHVERGGGPRVPSAWWCRFFLTDTSDLRVAYEFTQAR